MPYVCCSLELIIFLRNLDAALAFDSLECFINPSCAGLDMVTTRETHLVTSAGEMAVFLVTGAVAESHLREPYKSGYSTDKCVHHLRIVPFAQEFQIAMAYIGNAFNLQELVAPVGGPTFVLSSRKEGAGSSCE